MVISLLNVRRLGARQVIETGRSGQQHRSSAAQRVSMLVATCAW
jgi:hypothetical protein